MILASFEIVPHGMEDHPNRHMIGTMAISCESVNENNEGVYTSQLLDDGDVGIKYSVVRVFDHDRTKGAFELIRRCLREHLNVDNQS